MSKVPKGIVYEEPSHGGWVKEHFSSLSVYPIEPGKSHQNSFRVEEKHEVLEGVGVKFNVETLPVPKPEHLKKKKLERKDLFQTLKFLSSKFYKKEYSVKGYGSLPVTLEAVSTKVSENLVYTGGNGLFMCCVASFAQHLPLVLSPDDIWMPISYAFAQHVDKNAEELRDKFVKHKGKKRLFVRTSDLFEISSMENPDTGASAEEWEKEVFSAFSAQIKEMLGEKVHSLVTSDFTTTESGERVASEITLMAAMKKYFSFGMATSMCGIPNITLLGSEDDWISLREKTEALGEYMVPSFREHWLPLLLPVLDQFVEAFKGNVEHGFWQTMVKLRNTGGGSGSYEFISGWIQLLFPFLQGGEANNSMRPWQELYFTGPRPDEIPVLISSVPVDWTYHKKKLDLHFHAGSVGFSQNDEGALKPSIGWFVTHDPPKSPEYELELVQTEISDLLKGYEIEIEKAKDLTIKPYAKKKLPWYVRLKTLLQREEELLQQVPKSLRKKLIKNRKTRIKF